MTVKNTAYPYLNRELKRMVVYAAEHPIETGADVDENYYRIVDERSSISLTLEKMQDGMLHYHFSIRAKGRDAFFRILIEIFMVMGSDIQHAGPDDTGEIWHIWWQSFVEPEVEGKDAENSSLGRILKDHGVRDPLGRGEKLGRGKVHDKSKDDRPDIPHGYNPLR